MTDAPAADPEGSAPADASGPTTEVKRVGRRWRRLLVVVLAVLSCLSILVSTVGVWAHRTLLNTDSWVNAVAPLASNPAVTSAVSKEVTAQVLQTIDVEQVAQEALPDKAKFLAAPLSTGVEQFVGRAVDELLKTEQFQEFWVNANRKIHPVVVDVLRGDTKRVLTADGTVQLNLLPLIGKALTFVQSKAPGLFGSAGTIPDISVDTPPDQARAELSAALGRPLPDTFGTVTVFQSDKLKAAQDAVTMFDNLVIAMLIVTVLLVVATIVLALDRRRIIIGLSLGTVFAIAVASVVIGAIKSQVLDLIVDPDSRLAASDTISALVSRLHLLTDALVAIGLAVALIAFLTGPSRPATAIRRSVTRGVRYLGGKVDADGAPGALVWVQRYATELRWGGLVVGAGLLLFAVNGWWGLFLTLVIIGLFEAAVAYAAARGRDGAAAGAAPAAGAG
jgi:hypothetical protein